MTTQRSREGFVMLDHRHSPGVPDAIVIAAGLPAGAGHGLFKSATYKCNHCQAIVVLNPKRTRERAFCTGCNSPICDGCGVRRAAGLTCKPYKQVMDEIQERAVRSASIKEY
jgi:hypothetical protein